MNELQNLTLTSVVFEFYFCWISTGFNSYLTLTSVVFEFVIVELKKY